mgnify:CR=1 FL=1
MDAIRTLNLGSWDLLLAHDRLAQDQLFSMARERDYLLRFRGGAPDCIAILRRDEEIGFPAALFRKAAEAMAWDCKLPPDQRVAIEWCCVADAGRDPGDPPEFIRATKWHVSFVHPRPAAEPGFLENWYSEPE